jgi:hypothetical protein
VAYIKSDKPKNERKTRLKLFKMLSAKAVADLPKGLVKAHEECNKARAEYNKASEEGNKAYAEWKESGKAKVWHKKWCGCKEWDGKEIRFKG